MKLLLEQLPHQQNALKSILTSFSGLEKIQNKAFKNSEFSNPLIKIGI